MCVFIERQAPMDLPKRGEQEEEEEGVTKSPLVISREAPDVGAICTGTVSICVFGSNCHELSVLVENELQSNVAPNSE